MVFRYSCSLEAFAEEKVLGDVNRIGHDHRHGSKHGFEIVGQLSSAGIVGIHRDEDAHVRLKRNFLAGEHETLLLERQCDENRMNLLSHDGEDFDVDSVESTGECQRQQWSKLSTHSSKQPHEPLCSNKGRS